MSVEGLLARLLHEASVFVAEKRSLHDGTVEYILGTHVSFYPQRPRHLWYVLVILPGQTLVDEAEIEAILRRFWHAEIDVSTWVVEAPSDSN
jgi:hypothetical protein